MWLIDCASDLDSPVATYGKRLRECGVIIEALAGTFCEQVEATPLLYIPNVPIDFRGSHSDKIQKSPA
jgi:hypothetical protein